MVVAVASRLEVLDSKKNASPKGVTSGSLRMGPKSWGGHPSLLRMGGVGTHRLSCALLFLCTTIRVATTADQLPTPFWGHHSLGVTPGHSSSWSRPGLQDSDP